MRLYHAFVRAVRSPAAVAAALLILSSGGIPPSPSRAQTLVLNPALTGPIPATVSPGDPSHDYPFFSTTVDLASDGYVEEEFFFEGTV